MRQLSRRRLLRQATVFGLGGALGGSGPLYQRDDGVETERTNNAGRDWYNSVVPTGDGGALLSGARTVSEMTDYGENSYPAGWLRRLGADGSTVWSRTYVIPRLRADPPFDYVRLQFHTSIPNPSGGYLHIGSYLDGSTTAVLAWLVATDGTGSIQWEAPDVRPPNGSFADALRDGVVATDGGGYLLAGRALGSVAGDESHGDGWAVRLAPDGTVRWNRLYNSREKRYTNWRDDPEHDEFYGLTPTGDGTYVLVGEALGTDESASAGWFVEIDADGGKLRERTYDGGGVDLQFLDVARRDDGYVLAGVLGDKGGAYDVGVDSAARTDSSGVVFGVDGDGTVRWRTRVGSACNAVYEGSDGSLVVAGSRNANAAAWRLRGSRPAVDRIAAVDVGQSTFSDGAPADGEILLAGAVRQGSRSDSLNGLLATVAESPPQQHTLSVTKENAPDGFAAFYAVASGGIEPTDTAEGVRSATAVLDWLGPTAGTDTYRVTGDIDAFVLRGPATVRWRGDTVDPATRWPAQSVDEQSLDSTLRVESRGTGFGPFGVTTSGGIAPTDTFEGSTDGYNALDWVGPSRGTDELRFGGEITEFVSTDDIRAFVDGIEVALTSL